MSMISTRLRASVFDPKPVLPVRGLFSKAWTSLQRLNDLARSRRSLRDLSDAGLRDIGLSRHAALLEAHKTNWTLPAVIQALIKQSRKLPKELYRSLTWDRGPEMAGHKSFTLATDIDVFLCDPHSPWQRGTNENTNRLLRQYFPKGTDLSIHSQAKLSAVARQLNERQRKTLGYETPAERFNACVASIR